MQKVKCIPNIISFSRIILSFCLLAAMLKTTAFLILFVIAGITDILDGILARGLDAESGLGARLDSIGDIAFFMCATIGVFYIAGINLVLIIGAGIIMFARFINILLFKIKFKKWGGIHTLGNKISGLIVFLILFYMLIVKIINPYILISLLSLNLIFSVEEMILIFILKNNDINIKSIFLIRKSKTNAS